MTVVSFRDGLFPQPVEAPQAVCSSATRPGGFSFSKKSHIGENKMMNKQEILKAIRVCAKKLGRNPGLR
jgi:hypothetical protein